MHLSAYIRNDLAARLRSGRGVPQPLTLSALARHYQVSLTPVRQAVAELVDQGLLVRGPNRRLQVVRRGGKSRRQPSGPKGPPVEPTREVLPRLQADLVQLSLQGEAVFLREEATAARYGVSRSAMRNMLHQLAGSGLVDHVPRRGWRLRPFRVADMQAFLEVREALELKALELAWDHLEPEQLQRMLQRNRLPRRRGEHPRVDESLHAYLIEKAGNPYIEDFFRRHGPYYAVLFHWEDHDRRIALQTVRQHRAILRALLERNRRQARRLLSHHIRHNHPILGRLSQEVAKSGGDGVGPGRA